MFSTIDNAAVGPKAAFDTGPDQDSVRDNGGGTQVIECSDSFGSSCGCLRPSVWRGRALLSFISSRS